MGARSPRSRATRWLASGWLDVEFYEALRGRQFRDAAEAAEDFVEHGMQQRLSPHPFLNFVDLSPQTRGAWRRGRVARVLADVGAEPAPAPHVAASRDPAARAGLVALARQLGREGTSGPSEPPYVDWAAVAARTRRPDLTSVVLVAAKVGDTTRTVRSALDATDGDVQVLVVDCGSPAHVALGLQAALQEHPEVDLIRLPATVHASTGVNVGVSRSAGEIVLLLEPHIVLRRGAIDSMLALLDDSAIAGVQPVLLGPHDTIVSAGLTIAAEDAAPVPLLVGHPADDARRLEGHPLVAISPEVMVLRVKDLAALGGLPADRPRSAAALELGARLRGLRPGGFRVAPAARATVLEAAVVHTPPAHSVPSQDPALHERIGSVIGAEEPPASGPTGDVQATGRRPPQRRRRWSIKLPSTPGPAGDLWGDTHFAEALSGALRDLGEEVVTYRRGADAAGPTWLDDVSLALRGLHPIPPTPGQTNVLWVISHPDDVDPAELEGYDHVFAASGPWSAALSAGTGRTVLPLLQASHFEHPAEEAIEPDRAHDLGVVFVGNAGGGRSRPLVRMAVDAGVPLVVYGRGWHDLPDGVWQGDYVDNRRLPDLYNRHGIVLADHWPDMARHGFIANRVFDSVASGARVICDDVVGIHDVFDPRDVVVARDADELAHAVAEFRRTVRAADLPRPPLSFHDRARALLAEVSRARRD
ncbi:glycosyltransferase [Nocardioides sp.]|uniref:glycosyltransferase family protein n=1 Tax=Nocardioides sp. TaxID=35761 RepID=UPI0026058324|nr:glycosyltransferase [Nocardioides sp.]MDI6910897.1 glycosyltransferase [Nocardioides sp.]